VDDRKWYLTRAAKWIIGRLGFFLFLVFLVAWFSPYIALSAASRGNHELALNLWKPLAMLGDADSQFNLGLAYGKGRGTTRNPEEAVRWYRRAALQGQHEAEYNLAEHYRMGEGVGRDYAMTLHWLEKAAEHNHVSAQNNLGMMFADGTAGKQDLVQAVKWFSIAIANGSESAKSNRTRYAVAMTDAELTDSMNLAAQWQAAHPKKKA